MVVFPSYKDPFVCPKNPGFPGSKPIFGVFFFGPSILFDREGSGLLGIPKMMGWKM